MPLYISGAAMQTLSVSEEMNYETVRSSAPVLLYGSGSSNCGYSNISEAELAREQEKQ
jgi:hypothetical protein